MAKKEISDIRLFEPTGADMRRDYPELAEYDEFKDLTPRELKLCWYMGNRTSPIIKLPEKERIKVAMKQVYGESVVNRKDVKEIFEGKLPAKIQKGINRMSNFEVGIRLQAKWTTEYIFQQMNSMVYLSEAEIKAMDLDEKKKYADLALKVSSELPEVVKKLEHNYGIVRNTEPEGDNKIKVSIKDL